MTARIEELRAAVIEAAKAYADAVNTTPHGSRPNDGRLITATWALQRAEEVTKCVDCGAPLGYDDLRCNPHAEQIAEERRYNGRWDSIEDHA